VLAVTLRNPDFADPLSAIEIGEVADPRPRDGWVNVRLRAASLNHHDVWNMRGVFVDASWLPCVLGSDGAGVDEDGNDVIVYPIVADPARGGGDEMLDSKRRMLADGIDGTFAEVVAVPRASLVTKPPELSWEAAACLGTAWLTAYRMLFGRACMQPGETVLVQGAGGGLSTALVTLGRAAGLRVWVTSRDPEKARRAVEELGADAGFGVDEKLPRRVDAVMDSVGTATMPHSLRALRPGGRLVTVGATTGPLAEVDLSRVFLQSISILGCAMGSASELQRLAQLCATARIDPAIDSISPLAEAQIGMRRMVDGEVFGKVVFRCDAS
jgi:NADPH:quinone reductase-like Zn-dependent oxidoreductase